jgi:hypothetical protein
VEPLHQLGHQDWILHAHAPQGLIEEARMGQGQLAHGFLKHPFHPLPLAAQAASQLPGDGPEEGGGEGVLIPERVIQVEAHGQKGPVHGPTSPGRR